MRKVLVIVVFGILSTRFLWAGDLAKTVDKASRIILDFVQIPEESIPEDILKNCEGLAILTVAKAGFILSARGGVGVVVAKTSSGWSAPSAIGTGGAGFGLQIGGQVTDFVIVLNTKDAVEAFSQGGNVTLGGSLSVAAGPVGRSGEGALAPTAAVYSYSRSKGIFAGIALEGTVIVERKETNRDFYGRDIRSYEILNGKIPIPPEAKPLIDILNKYSRPSTGDAK